MDRLGPSLFEDRARASRCLVVNKAPKMCGPGRSWKPWRMDDLVLISECGIIPCVTSGGPAPALGCLVTNG